jgi:hypothetical protein
MSAAGVPGRGEYWNVNAELNRARSTTSSVSAKSASVSPGKPTMNEVRTATPGTRSRILSTMPSRFPRPVGRFIRRRTGSLACCSGMSTYLTTFSSDAIASRIGSLRVAG